MSQCLGLLLVETASVIFYLATIVNLPFSHLEFPRPFLPLSSHETPDRTPTIAKLTGTLDSAFPGGHLTGCNY